MQEIAESSIGLKLLQSHMINCSLCKNVTYKIPANTVQESWYV